MQGVPSPPATASQRFDSAARARRVALIRTLEAATGTSVIAYITGDRPQLQTVLASDAQAIVYSHLQALDLAGPTGPDHQLGIGLVLYTSGGITTSAWGLVNLIREFADRFVILVPYKALSAGTLVALGADRAYLTRLAQLSPVDPSLNSPYNPTIPAPPGSPPQFLPVSVEAVMGYISLTKNEIGIKSDEALSGALRGLTDKVHPLALGDVYRSREQITALATRLLKMGTRELPDVQIREIVETLTKKLGSHDYLINRTEAKQLLGSWVEDAPPGAESALMHLFKEYSELLALGVQFNPEEELTSSGGQPVSYVRAVVESTRRFDAFVSVRRYRRITVAAPGPIPMPVEGTQQTIMSEGWRCLDGDDTN
jgi:Serine dehydrogenase proteinase